MNKQYIANEQISADVVMLVLDNGKVYGEISIKEALDIAQNSDLDLVEVSKSSKVNVPVCKLIDCGKLKYQNEKKQKKNKNKKMKEIRYSINISDHDLKVKHRKVFDCLNKNIKVKYSLELRGRQSNMVEEGKNRIMDNLQDFKDVAKWQEPQMNRSRSFTSFSTILNFP